MKLVCSILALGLFLIGPTGVLADSVVDYAHSAGLAVTTEPPQASAEALLKLPSVYILPGSFIYWCKQIVEDIHLFFTIKPQDRAALLMDMSNQRLAEGYQAMKKGQWPAAVAALQRYQQTQQSLQDSLQKLNLANQQWQPLVKQLQEQLKIQASLQQYANTRSAGSADAKTAAQSHEVGLLLEHSVFDHLAYVVYPNQAVLGASDQEQATTSAQASASAQPTATASAQVQEVK